MAEQQMPTGHDYKIEIYIPEEFVPELREALAAAGAGQIGNYDNCIAYALVHGSWRPLKGSDPYAGEIGQISEGTEARVDVNCAAQYVGRALRAIRRVHPYEEPLINVIPLANHLFASGEDTDE